MIQINEKSKILITRTDRIGDLVLSTPVFREIKKRFPDVFLSVLTFTENREIIETHPSVDEIILYDKKGCHKNFIGNLKLANQIRNKKFDLVIHLHATNRMHLLTWLAGVPIRIGWDRRLPWALTDVLPYEKKTGQKHEAFYNFIPLKLIDVPEPRVLETFFSVTPKNIISIKEFFKQRKLFNKNNAWVAVNPFASGPEKMWPQEKFAELINRIKKNYDAEVFIIGTKNDRMILQSMKEKIKVSFWDLTGQLSLGMLGAFLKECDLLISNDSGPVHIAQAVGLYTISIFVREQEGLSSKRWGPVGDHSVCMDRLPVEVDHVFKAVEVSSRLKEFLCEKAH